MFFSFFLVFLFIIVVFLMCARTISSTCSKIKNSLNIMQKNRNLITKLNTKCLVHKCLCSYLYFSCVVCMFFSFFLVFFCL